MRRIVIDDTVYRRAGQVGRDEGEEHSGLVHGRGDGLVLRTLATPSSATLAVTAPRIRGSAVAGAIVSKGDPVDR